jgi:Coenzyme PQQ synthesis protein D (PqqD)
MPLSSATLIVIDGMVVRTCIRIGLPGSRLPMITLPGTSRTTLIGPSKLRLRTQPLVASCGTRERGHGRSVALMKVLHTHSETRQMLTTTPHLRSVIDHDGAVILDIPRNTIITLNPTGAYIWQRLEQGMTIDAIVSELALETGADEKTIANDVSTFMDELKSKHLVAIS